ncbi:hypothetical protein LXA43DRAFT_1093795 [Ganoderma leucocontextum]|nr:hypothetical protein LXA43DRAFT_1093795 [Ganoderma leucocontextum]
MDTIIDLFVSRMKAETIQTMREDVETFLADVKTLGVAVDGVKADITAVACFTNALHIEKAKLWNMMQPRPDNLQHVPGPQGTLPWNTAIQGLNGEEIVLAPLDSLDAVQALGANELGAYVQLYYPGREVPKDLKERKRELLLAIGRPSESHTIV